MRQVAAADKLLVISATESIVASVLSVAVIDADVPVARHTAVRSGFCKFVTASASLVAVNVARSAILTGMIRMLGIADYLQPDDIQKLVQLNQEVIAEIISDQGYDRLSLPLHFTIQVYDLGDLVRCHRHVAGTHRTRTGVLCEVDLKLSEDLLALHSRSP
jgi:hypothetical protein